jgi:tetratricopeptide (TPR) repeat protein
MRPFGASAVMAPAARLEPRVREIAWAGPLAALMIVLLAAGSAAAQSAHDLYQQGVQALSTGRYTDAAQALDASYRKEPSANTLYNLGLAYKGMGHPDRALEAFESYVKLADPKKDAKTIAAVRSEIERLKSAYARYSLKLSPTEAIIEIDGTAVSPSHGELWVQSGKHKITVRADGYDTYDQTLDVAAGHFDLEVRLRQPSGTPAERAAALVDEGIALQAASSLQPAIEKYKAAQAIYPTPRAAAQQGLAEESLGELPDAEQHLAEALGTPKDPFVRENKRKLKAALDRVKRQLATLTITGVPDGAEIFVNGKSVGVLPLAAPVHVIAGNLTVTAKKQGYSQYEELLQLPARGQRRVRVSLDEAPAPPVVVPVPLAVPTPAPTPQPEAAVPALTAEQPAPAPVPVQAPPPPSKAAQADIEAQAEPAQEEEPQPTGPRPSATGFEAAFNFGYQPFIGGPKTEGSSGLLTPQILLGARLVWPLSFGIQINGGFNLGNSSTSFVMAANPGLYVRGHVQQYKKRLGLDAWGGVGLQPVALQVAALKANKTIDPTKVDPNSLDPSSVQAQLARQKAGVDHVHTVQSINVPFELGSSFFITEGFGFDLAMALTLWLPQQSCLHDGQNRLCSSGGLKSQTSLFIGAGITLLP